jgi:nicotinamidase-related amidase
MVTEHATDTDTRFLRWLDGWIGSLPTANLEGGPGTAVVVVDMVNGFCRTGNLASERVGALISPVTRLMSGAREHGVTNFILAEDTHRENDQEFAAFPPHCVRGTGEEKTVTEIRELPFSEHFEYFPKPTLNISVGTQMDARLRQLLESGVDTFVVVGDCTDFCVYQAATTIKLSANAMDKKSRVIIPADTVDTYDLPLDAALGSGALPHPGDTLHKLFLYHLALIGCEVVAGVSWVARA